MHASSGVHCTTSWPCTQQMLTRCWTVVAAGRKPSTRRCGGRVVLTGRCTSVCRPSRTARPSCASTPAGTALLFACMDHAAHDCVRWVKQRATDMLSFTMRSAMKNRYRGRLAVQQRSTVKFHLVHAWRRWKDPPPNELLHTVAASTAGFAGADLAALCSAAVHAAVRRAAPSLLEQLDRRVAALPKSDDARDSALGSSGAAPMPAASDDGEPALGSSPQRPAAQAANGRAGQAQGPGPDPEDLPPSVDAPIGDADLPLPSAEEAPLSAAPNQELPAAAGRQAAQAAHAAGRDGACRDGALLDAVQVLVPPRLHHAMTAK